MVQHWEYYKTLRNFCNTAVRNEKRAYFNHVFGSRDNKALWKELNSLGINKNKVITVPQQLADANKINDYFIHSIPSVNNPGNFTLYDNEVHKHLNFSFSFVTTDTVAKRINNIKSNAIGHDNINIQMIRLCCPVIIPYVTHILNSCIEKIHFHSVGNMR